MLNFHFLCKSWTFFPKEYTKKERFYTEYRNCGQIAYDAVSHSPERFSAELRENLEGWEKATKIGRKLVRGFNKRDYPMTGESLSNVCAQLLGILWLKGN